MSKIIVVGSLNMDLVTETSVIPVLGETVLGSDFSTVPGGKGANQAVAAARLGGEVYMAGCVGNDIFGKNLVENLKNNNVNIDNVEVTNDTSTGVAVIIVKDGNNCIIVNSGANFIFNNGMIDNIEHLFSEDSILVLQHEIPMESVEYAIKLAKKHNTRVLLNPAPAKPLSDEILSMVDIVTPNEFECENITGKKVETVEDAKESVKYLINKGIKQIIITMGGRGVVYNSGEKVIHKAINKVQVVDTTAAGDSFSGAVAVALSEGKTIDEAIKFANKVGALTVTKKGAQTSLPTREEVENFL